MEIIRKIVVGSDPTRGMAFVVGNPVGSNYTIDSIARDKKRANVFHIFVKSTEDVRKWKEVSGDYIVEMDLDF